MLTCDMCYACDNGNSSFEFVLTSKHQKPQNIEDEIDVKGRVKGLFPKFHNFNKSIVRQTSIRLNISALTIKSSIVKRTSWSLAQYHLQS